MNTRTQRLAVRLCALVGIGLCAQFVLAGSATASTRQTPTTTTTSASASTSTSTTSTTKVAVVSTTKTTAPPGAVPSRAEPDPVDAWAWNRIAPVVLSSLLAAGVALLVSWRGNKRAEKRFVIDQERLNLLRRADRLKEATVAVSEVAQAWIEAIARVQRDAKVRRDAWAETQSRREFLETQIPEMKARLKDLEERLERDGGGPVREAQMNVHRTTSAEIPLLELDYEGLPERAARQADELRDVVSTATRGFSSRWVHVRGQAELMAPGLIPAVIELEAALQSWEGETQMIDRPVPVDRVNRAHFAYASLIAEALRQTEGLEAPIGTKAPQAAPPTTQDVLRWLRNSQPESDSDA